MCAADEHGGYPETLQHEPVMVHEVLEYLHPQPGKIFVDATLGGGSHALAIAKHLGPNGCLIGIEQDIEALARARQRLHGYPVRYIHDNFRHLDNIISTLSVDGVDGFLFDLGVSSFQFDSPERGFSFRFGEANLDMRMDHASP